MPCVFLYLRVSKPRSWRFGPSMTSRFVNGLVSRTGPFKMKTLSSFETSWTADRLIPRHRVASQPSFDVMCRSANSSFVPKNPSVYSLRSSSSDRFGSRKPNSERHHVLSVVGQPRRLQQVRYENLWCRFRGGVIYRTVVVREHRCLFRIEFLTDVSWQPSGTIRWGITQRIVTISYRRSRDNLSGPILMVITQRIMIISYRRFVTTYWSHR
jgi:hypothetical protein